MWIIGNTIIIFGPSYILKHAVDDPKIGVGVGLLGVISSIYGYWSKKTEKYQQKIKSIISATGLKAVELAAFIFILSLFVVVSFSLALIAHWLSSDKDALTLNLQQYEKITTDAAMSLLFYIWITLALLGWAASYFIGTNAFSLHNMYGNRLVRTYLGASNSSTRKPDPFTGFDLRDNCNMKALLLRMKAQQPGEKRLFHIVNIALNMVKPSAKHLDWQQRKAAAFTVSPLHAGCDRTGYQDAATYSGPSGISLARAMTISGAAASPNMGYHSSTLVGFVMAFFNIRLGWWLPNPDEIGKGHWQNSEPKFGPMTLISESLSDTTAENKYVYLSDGGHFENLGLYEMVRRRCKEIVVVDASCDPEYIFEDLDNAVRKIRVDFGISIVFPEGLPTPAWARGDKYKHRHFTIGVIRYSDVDAGNNIDGRIIYIKPLLSGDESLDLKRYAARVGKNPRFPFPHHSTADQFFDEVQFESYRALGYHSIDTHHFPRLGKGTYYRSSRRDADEDFVVQALEAKDKKADADTAPARTKDGAASAFNIGIIWALLAIAGAIAVLGSVRDPAPAQIQGQIIRFDDALPGQPSPANDSSMMAELKEIKQLLQDLIALMKNPPAIDSPPDPAILNVVEKQILQIDNTSQKNSSEQIQAMTTTLEQIRNQMPRSNEVTDGLNKILRKLNAIDTTVSNSANQTTTEVRQTNPRANVRPAEGGRP